MTNALWGWISRLLRGLGGVAKRTVAGAGAGAVGVSVVATIGVGLTAFQGASAQTFDPSDPYRTVFLDQLSALVDAAEIASKDMAELQALGGDPASLDLRNLRRLQLELDQELQACGTQTRQGVEGITMSMLNNAFGDKHRMDQIGLLVQMLDAGYRSDFASLDRVIERLDPAFLLLEDMDGLPGLSTGEALPSHLMQVAGAFLAEEGFHRTILAIGDRLNAKGALSETWLTGFYPQAMFFMGEIEQLRAHATRYDVDLIDDWLVTAALRAGAEQDALDIQAKIDAVEPDNLSRILFFESPGSRAAHCGNMIQGIRESSLTSQLEEEADGGRQWFGSWSMLVCGEFADARRAALKASWAKRRGNCAQKQTNISLVNHYNAILAGVYEAADLREAGARERSTELLDRVAEEVRQALFLDRFTAYSNLEIVIEDDIAIYMDRLHGPRPELSLVKGMLERGRGELERARADFVEALRLSGVGPSDRIDAETSQSEGLDVKWLLQLTAWIEELDALLS